MKLLLDTCVWGGQLAELIAGGHDVAWVGDWSEDPGDEEILAHAGRDNEFLSLSTKTSASWWLSAVRPTRGLSAW